MSNAPNLPINLQPPGAGLPFHEQAVAKIIARLLWPLETQNKALERFNREADIILELVGSIPSEQARMPVLIKRFIGIEDSSRNWSVFMVLDHLRIVDESTAQIIKAISIDRPYTKEIRIQDVKPNINADSASAEAFANTVASFEKTIRQLGTLNQNLSHAHPWFGLLNAHGWLCLAGFHHRIHRRQIERIKKLLSAAQ